VATDARTPALARLRRAWGLMLILVLATLLVLRPPQPSGDPGQASTRTSVMASH